MRLNLNFDGNYDLYQFIVLCIIAIAGLIIGIVSFTKPDVELEVSGGIVDPNAITIDAYLESKQGIDYMNKYLQTKFHNLFVKKGLIPSTLKVLNDKNDWVLLKEGPKVGLSNYIVAPSDGEDIKIYFN